MNKKAKILKNTLDGMCHNGVNVALHVELAYNIEESNVNNEYRQKES
jgi:hypothetical protein